MTSFFYLSRQYILFLGYVIAATGTLPYIKGKDKDVPIEVFDVTNTAVTCKNLPDIRVGHLLSEFLIEFVSELWCRILLSKVTTKVSELRCRMWIESGFRQ